MSACDFSTTSAGSALLALLDGCPMTVAPSSSPSSSSSGTGIDDLLEASDRTISRIGVSPVSDSFGHDIRCDFLQHSFSDPNSVSASPGPASMVVQSKVAAAGVSSLVALATESLPVSNGSRKSSGRERASGTDEAIDKHSHHMASSSSSLGDLCGDSSNGRGSELGGVMSACPMECAYCHRPYRQPRLLLCLHSFCEDCIVAMLEGRHDDRPKHELDVELQPSVAVDTKPPPGVVRCPMCKQDSNVGNDLRFVQLLTLDYVTANMQEVEAMEHAQLVCESCKAKEKAVARCFDCSNFLCLNCVQAHQYMRCFESHKVRTFDEIQEQGQDFLIHKPITCPEHPNEQIRYYCSTCKIPVCNECIVANHNSPEHQHEKVNTDLDVKLRCELDNLVNEGKLKVQSCETTTQELHQRVSNLQDRSDSAKIMVEDAFSTYVEILSRRKDELIQEIEREHVRLENELMNTLHRMGNTAEKISDALSFTQRLLKNGNTMEILCTKKVVREQLTCLIRSVPLTNVAINLRFVSSAEEFGRSVKETFGTIKTEVEPAPIERVNVDELLKKINCLNVNGTRMGIPPPLSQGINGVRLGMPSTDVHYLPLPIPSGPINYNQQMNDHYSDDAAAFTNYARIVANAVTAGDYYGHTNGNADHVRSSTAVSPAEQTSIQTSMSNSLRVLSSTSPVEIMSNFDSTPNANSGSFSGGSSRGVMPNLSMPPPTSRYPNATVRSTPPISYDLVNGPLIGIPSVFTPGTLQNSLLQSSVQSGLNPPIRVGQMNQMQTKSRFGLLGPGQGQFNSPHGFCLTDMEEIAVADTNNHRIQVFSLNGEFRTLFGNPGKEEGQLWYPRKIAFLRGPGGVSSGRFIVCDRGSERSRMQIFSRSGHFVKRIAVRYIDIVAGLAIDRSGRIVAVDSVTPTVFCIDYESGELLRWFDCAEYMREPSDIAVSDQEYYICDFKGHCVCVFAEDGRFLRRIGCEGITNFPNGIDISDDGDVLIGDSHGNRFHVAIFRKNGELSGEYDCPYTKVSRCCGLRITRDGFIITLAKNNHNVLVLNTLFVGSQNSIPGI